MTVFGIRPDFIRSSVLLKKMLDDPDINLQFVYTGQHYDDALKGVFFRELQIPEPNYVLNTAAQSHVQQHAKLISQLEKVLQNAKPDVCLFLGDANAVIGCIAPLKMGIPIAHVEAGMRSYDWRMPEERNRVIVDRVSDVLYCYQHDYKYRLVQEGIDPDKIVVTGNTIVDVLKLHAKTIGMRAPEVLKRFGLMPKNYALMTLHRTENVQSPRHAGYILRQVGKYCTMKDMKVVLPVMPRLRQIVKDFKEQSTLSQQFIFTEPLGFFDFVALESTAYIEFTDSGTNQETSAILGIPCVVTRQSTERPETFDSGITVMENNDIINAAIYVAGRRKKKGFSLGDGTAAQTIVDDLLHRLKYGFQRYTPPVNNFMARNWQTFSGEINGHYGRDTYL